MRKIFILILLSIWSNAEITDEKDFYSLICSVEESVGFNWKNSKWIFTKFYPNKYIVKKLKVEKFEPGNKEIPKSGLCWNEMQFNEPLIFDNKKFIYGCYNVREHGTEFYPTSSKKCFEEWEKVGTKYKLKKVVCEDFKFNPNGWFHSSFIHDNIENNPKDNYKDSIGVEYGKCSNL